MITYEARQDNVGAMVPAKAVRRCLVLKYRNGQFAYVCGAFATMKGAEKRAAELNKSEAAA